MEFRPARQRNRPSVARFWSPWRLKVQRQLRRRVASSWGIQPAGARCHELWPESEVHCAPAVALENAPKARQSAQESSGKEPIPVLVLARQPMRRRRVPWGISLWLLPTFAAMSLSTCVEIWPPKARMPRPVLSSPGYYKETVVLLQSLLSVVIGATANDS